MPDEFVAPADYEDRVADKHEEKRDVIEKIGKNFKNFKQEFVDEFTQGMSNKKLVGELESANWRTLTVSNVLAIQTLLYRLGFNSKSNIDGGYAWKAVQHLRSPEEIKARGSKTQKAVLAFQERFGLQTDGQFGPQSFGKLKEVFASLQGSQKGVAEQALPTEPAAQKKEVAKNPPKKDLQEDSEKEQVPSPSLQKVFQSLQQSDAFDMVSKPPFQKDGRERIFILTKGQEGAFILTKESNVYSISYTSKNPEDQRFETWADQTTISDSFVLHPLLTPENAVGIIEKYIREYEER